VPCHARNVTSSPRRAFERTSKRRRGFPSESNVKRGDRVVHGDKELLPSRSSVGRIRARADRAVGSRPVAETRVGFDGDLDDYSR